jgi:hypothetical protein
MSMTELDQIRLRRALDDYATVPAHLVTADELADAAQANLEAIRGEQEPDLTKLTAKTIGKTTEALAAWSRRAEREAAATRILSHAQNLQASAWFEAMDGTHETFRAPFNAAAETFTRALDELDGHTDPGHAVRCYRSETHRTLIDAANILCDLAAVRDALAVISKANLASTAYDHPTRLVTFPSLDVFSRLLPVRAGHHGRGTLEWFAAVLTIPGTRIQWNTPAEQEAILATLPSESTAYTASAGA